MNVSAYVGLPYQRNGCWHLVRRVYADEYGIALQAYDDEVPASANRHDVASVIEANQREWAPAESEREGDVILFRVLGANSHVGIVLPGRLFLHAFGTDKTSRVDSYRAPIWAPRIEGFYRHAARHHD